MASAEDLAAADDPFESDEEYEAFLADLYAPRRHRVSLVVLDTDVASPLASWRSGHSYGSGVRGTCRRCGPSSPGSSCSPTTVASPSLGRDPGLRPTPRSKTADQRQLDRSRLGRVVLFRSDPAPGRSGFRRHRLQGCSGWSRCRTSEPPPAARWSRHCLSVLGARLGIRLSDRWQGGRQSRADR